MHILHASLLAAALGASAISPALAVTNGSFENGLSGWETLGDVAPFQAFAIDGLAQALLTTASVDFQDDAPAAAGEFNWSGIPAAEVGMPDGIEDFVGLAIGALDPDPDNFVAAYEGSAMRQSFSVNVGDTLYFDWVLASVDFANPDYAFAVIDGQFTRLGDTGDLVNFDNGIGFTAPATFSHTFALGGEITLAFGVVDVLDFNGSSALLVDNVRIAPVPEPETWAMLLAGLGLLGLVARRKFQA
jgi:hypothetical protein